MTIDTKSRRRTKVGGNVFLDLGFSPKEAKRLLAQTDAQIDESIRLKQQLMDEIAEWMKETSVTQAAAAEVLRVTRPRVSDVVRRSYATCVGVSLPARIAHARLIGLSGFHDRRSATNESVSARSPRRVAASVSVHENMSRCA